MWLKNFLKKCSWAVEGINYFLKNFSWAVKGLNHFLKNCSWAVKGSFSSWMKTYIRFKETLAHRFSCWHQTYKIMAFVRGDYMFTRYFLSIKDIRYFPLFWHSYLTSIRQQNSNFYYFRAQMCISTRRILAYSLSQDEKSMSPRSKIKLCLKGKCFTQMNILTPVVFKSIAA